MRIRSDIWVQGFLRICQSVDAMAVVARRGDPTAGAVYVKICLPERKARLYGPKPMSFEAPSLDRELVAVHETPQPEFEVDDHMAMEAKVDRDLWLVEVEHCRDPEVLHRWLTERSAPDA